jgi:hypothetical protein
MPGQKMQSNVWIVNDFHQAYADASLKIAVIDASGKRVMEKSVVIDEIAADSSQSVYSLEWTVQGDVGDEFQLVGELVDAEGKVISSNHQRLLVGDQELARQQASDRAKAWGAYRSQFPTADYYRFFPEYSGEDRAETFGDQVPKATLPELP